MESLPPAARPDVTRAYDRAAREPQSASAAGAVAILLHAHDRLGEARTWYEHAGRLDPGSFQWAYGEGLTAFLTGRHPDAVPPLRRAIAIDSRRTPARVHLAEALLSAGELTECAAVARALAADVPDLPQAHYLLGRAASAAGDHQGAAGHFLKAIELFPAYGAAHYGIALAYRNLGDSAGAAASLARYEQHRMETPPLEDTFLDGVDERDRGGARLVESGVVLANAGRADEAIAQFERALAATPSLAQAHVHLIALYAGKGDLAGAEKHYRAALRLNSHAADAHYNYGVLLLSAGRIREAGETFRKALEASPHHAPARNNLGQVLEAEERTADAADQYQAAVEADPGFRVARFNLGRILVALGRPEDAIEHFRRTLEPNDAATPTYMYALAAAYARSGDRDSALRYAQEAQRRAEQLGQQVLAATIARDLETLKR